MGRLTTFAESTAVADYRVTEARLTSEPAAALIETLRLIPMHSTTKVGAPMKGGSAGAGCVSATSIRIERPTVTSSIDPVAGPDVNPPRSAAMARSTDLPGVDHEGGKGCAQLDD